MLKIPNFGQPKETRLKIVQVLSIVMESSFQVNFCSSKWVNYCIKLKNILKTF